MGGLHFLRAIAEVGKQQHRTTFCCVEGIVSVDVSHGTVCRSLHADGDTGHRLSALVEHPARYLFLFRRLFFGRLTFFLLQIDNVVYHLIVHALAFE